MVQNHHRSDSVTPIQGLDFLNSVPRALPWAVLCCAFSAEQIEVRVVSGGVADVLSDRN